METQSEFTHIIFYNLKTHPLAMYPSLATLTEYIVWQGKYPIPLKLENMPINSI